MEDINLLLEELASNENFAVTQRNPNSSIEEPSILYSGFPSNPDQFYKLQRPNKATKKQSDQEFEEELISKINILNNALFEHKTDVEIVKKARTQIGISIQDLAIIMTNKIGETYLRAHSKFQLLSEMYDQLDVIVTGTKTRKLKKPDIEITQPQIVLLFHHLQQLGMISKNVPNTTIASSISDITGLSYQQIRQALSSISVHSVNVDADFKPTDYNVLNRKIKALQQNLEKEYTARFK